MFNKKIPKPKIILSSFILVTVSTIVALLLLNSRDSTDLSVPTDYEPSLSNDKDGNSNSRSPNNKHDVDRVADDDDRNSNNDGSGGDDEQTDSQLKNNADDTTNMGDKNASNSATSGNSSITPEWDDNPTTVYDNPSEEIIPFQTETANEVNLPRGEIKVAREGANGLRKILTRLTYQNNNLISSNIISSEIIKEPINQLNLVGVSDYNLNNSYIQFYPNASISRNNSSAPAFMILVNDNYYIDFWYDPITWVRVAPTAAIPVSSGNFTYDGNNYNYSTGPVNNSYALSEAFCKEYGLACGRW